MIILRLKEVMQEHNISQRELSRQTGIRQGTISDYVNNTFKMINREHLETLCDFFNCTVDDLIERRIIKFKKHNSDKQKE
jgi:putative transcriptional regulator